MQWSKRTADVDSTWGGATSMGAVSNPNASIRGQARCIRSLTISGRLRRHVARLVYHCSAVESGAPAMEMPINGSCGVLLAALKPVTRHMNFTQFVDESLHELGNASFGGQLA